MIRDMIALVFDAVEYVNSFIANILKCIEEYDNGIRESREKDFVSNINKSRTTYQKSLVKIERECMSPMKKMFMSEIKKENLVDCFVYLQEAVMLAETYNNRSDNG